SYCWVEDVFGRFFFSSRRRHTRFSRDWSSDVCSSDLDGGIAGSWSAYYYNGYVYSADIRMGLDVLRIDDPLTDPAKDVKMDDFKIGRASCRERVQMSVDGGSLKHKREVHSVAQ